MTEPTTRTELGQFPKGVSGNPAGRPKGKKNELTELKQDLEIAIRRRLTPEKIGKIVDKMVQMAEEGDVKAAKLILDKTISNTRESDDVDANNRGGITIRIENATFAKQREQPQAVDADFTEIPRE